MDPLVRHEVRLLGKALIALGAGERLLGVDLQVYLEIGLLGEAFAAVGT